MKAGRQAGTLFVVLKTTLYEFIDDDTLKVCYPESGFKAGTPPQDRPRPTRFYSDGDRNLWVMKRQPTVASKEPVKP